MVDRWSELEKEANKPIKPRIQDEQAVPKFHHYKTIIDERNTSWLKIGMSAMAINKTLMELSVYNNSIKRSKIFKQDCIDMGYGVMK